MFQRYSVFGRVKMIFYHFHILKMKELAKSGQNAGSLLANVHVQDDDYTLRRIQNQNALHANEHDQGEDHISYPPYHALSNRLLRTIAKTLELELNAILQEVRGITDKLKDEVLLTKYIVRNFWPRFRCLCLF